MAVLKKTMSNIFVIFLIVLILFVPHVNVLTDQIYAIDRFFHFDYFVMSAGWAHLKGLTIFMDVNSNYSVGMTIFLSRLASFLGGFDYASMAFVVMFLGVAYWCVAFLFLRSWMNNLFLAVFGVFLAICLNMFHGGVAPIVWRFPSATVIRHLFDVAVFFVLLQHSRTEHKKYLWLASACCAFSIVYMLDTGVYLTLSFFVYLSVQVLFKQTRAVIVSSVKDASNLALLMAMPFVGGGILLFLMQGPTLFKPEYWQNATEYSRLFLNGFGDLPVTYALGQRQYLAFAFGLIIPVFYVGTLLLVVTLLGQGYFKRKDALAIFFACYGLLLYHYYIYRSGPTSYGAVIVPCVFLICFWLQKIMEGCKGLSQQVLKILLTMVVVLMFAFNPYVRQYPNIFYKTPSKVAEHFDADLKVDIDLIQGLTNKDQAVPLISSFETKILIAADRKPFFYYFPFIYSVPFDVMDFHGTEILTTQRLQKTIGQMEGKHPEYVFVETKLFKQQLHPLYYAKYTALRILLSYLNDRYTLYKEGKYLCALRLK